MSPLELPADVEERLAARAAGRERPLAAAVARLSDAFVEGAPPRDPSDDERLAYALYYGPVGALKVAAVLAELRERGWAPPAEALRLADLGSGPGTATLGAFIAGVSPRLAATLADRDPRWDPAVLLGAAVERGTVVITRAGGDPFAARGPFDVVVAANFLVELGLDVDALARRVEEHAAQELAPGGVWIAVEPATRAVTRRLHELRDALVGRGLAVLAPCLHQEPCPMLARPSDWCHESREWRQPAYHRTIDQLAGLEKRALQFSFLALGRVPPAPAEGLAARVVSTVQREKGRTRFRSCDACGRLREWDLLRRTRGPIAERVATLARGDRVVLPHDRGGRLTADDSLRDA